MNMPFRSGVETAATLPAPASLSLEAVTCRFGQVLAVDGVSLEIAPGSHVALVGANGSGKSTLLRAILGFHASCSGRILVDGIAATSQASWNARRRRLAWIPQRQVPGRFPLLVRELLESSGNIDAAVSAAHRLGVKDLVGHAVHTLSGGQLQRVFLARALGALSKRAGLLLADEPTSALDFDGQHVVADEIGQLAATVLVVTHDRALADRCDQIFEMAGGQLRKV